MDHLLSGPEEQAAFVFARGHLDNLGYKFTPIEWRTIPTTGFHHQSSYHLEMTDTARRDLIRRAHELEASLVEFHSHPSARPAQFSWSDIEGLREFVPHVRWRLQHRPYIAIVVGLSSFDALVWCDDHQTPTPLCHLDVEGKALQPTGLTLKDIDHDDQG
jgi:hypothetical protein